MDIMQKTKIVFIVKQIVCLAMKMDVLNVIILIILINQNVLNAQTIVINALLILVKNVK